MLCVLLSIVTLLIISIRALQISLHALKIVVLLAAVSGTIPRWISANNPTAELYFLTIESSSVSLNLLATSVGTLWLYATGSNDSAMYLISVSTELSTRETPSEAILVEVPFS